MSYHWKMIKVLPPEDRSFEFSGDHILIVTPLRGPLLLGGGMESYQVMLGEIVESCRIRGINVRFVGGQFGAAGTSLVGPLVRVLKFLASSARVLISRSRRKRKYEESQRLGWEAAYSFRLVLAEARSAQGRRLFAAQMLELIRDIEKRLEANFGAYFALSVGLGLAVSSNRHENILSLSVEPDSLRGAAFSDLFALCEKVNERQHFYVRRSIIWDSPKLYTKHPRPTRDNGVYLSVLTEAQRNPR